MCRSHVAFVHGLLERADNSLAKIFVLIGLPAVLFFIFFVPPFQVPDEFAQLLRADQISFGVMVGTRLDATRSGGYAATSYRLLAEIFATQAANARAATARLAQATGIPLTNKREFFSFPNTVQYGPIAYAPQAIALVLARILGISALASFYLARLLNGATALLIGFLSIRTAGRGRYLIFSFLTMPTALFFMGSLSQDALLLTGSALFVSIVSSIVSKDQPPGAAAYIALVGLLVVLAWGRLPYVMLCVVFLLPPFHNMQWRGNTFHRWPAGAAIALAIGLATFWAWIVNTVHIELSAAASVQKQLSFLVSHLQLIPEIAINSLHGTNFWFAVGGIFGSLGVFNSRLPLLFYPIALTGAVAAAALETVQEDKLKPADRIVVAVGLLLGIGSIFLALYVTDNPVGQLSIAGIQGRYLIPFVFGAAFILPTASVDVRKSIRQLVLLLPLIALINFGFSIEKIMMRYY